MKFQPKKIYQALAMLVFTSAPLTHSIAATTEEKLGQALYNDSNLSLFHTHSCETCHTLNHSAASASFIDPIAQSLSLPVSMGTKPFTFGSLNAPTAGYAAFSPPFGADAASGEYIGGQFWNGRSSTLADQAEGPFLNPVEMRMPSKWAVITRLKSNRTYVKQFNKVYGIDLNSIPANPHASATSQAPASVDEAYRAMVIAIGEFEKTRTFNRFTSKYDFHLAGQASLTGSEQRGLQLFNGKAGCNTCHTSNLGKDTRGRAFPPLFTDFKYHNLGLPRNHKIPGRPSADIGLAGNDLVIAQGRASREHGKHKTPTLRNIAITSPYFHNGVIGSLEKAVHFINTRDTLPKRGTNKSWGFGTRQWAAAEISNNVTSNHVGNLGLSSSEERDIVAFLRTLTDGYRNKKKSKWTNRARPIIDQLHPNP